MTLADEMRKETEEAMYNKIKEAINEKARQGENHLDVCDTNGELTISSENEKKLTNEGFQVYGGTRISW